MVNCAATKLRGSGLPLRRVRPRRAAFSVMRLISRSIASGGLRRTTSRSGTVSPLGVPAISFHSARVALPRRFRRPAREQSWPRAPRPHHHFQLTPPPHPPPPFPPPSAPPPLPPLPLAHAH